MGKSLLRLAALLSLSAGLMTAQNLRIVRAEYGHDSRWADVTDVVRRESRGGRLDLLVNNQTFGMDPAPAEVKTLRIEYSVNGRSTNEEIPENTRLVLPRQRGGDGRQVYRDGITILSAQYGSGRRRVDVSRQVSAFIRDGRLQMRVNNDTMGGDPERGADKSLRIEYEFNGQRDTVEVGEDNDLVLPRPGIGGGYQPPPQQQGPAARGRLEILSASYGARDRFMDVSVFLRRTLGRENQLQIPVTNEALGGDPIPGVEKILRVEYRVGGRTMRREVRESETLVLP